MDDFETFWKAYPRKIAKGDARKAWLQTAKIRPDLDLVLKAVSEARKHWDNPAFIPYAATWLRAERWDDCYDTEVLTVAETKAWHETSSGIEAKGLELGLDQSSYPHFPAYKEAVMRAYRQGAN